MTEEDKAESKDEVKPETKPEAEGISGVDIFNSIFDIIGNPLTRQIIHHYSKDTKVIITLTELAKEFKSTDEEVDFAIEPLVHKRILRKSTGKKQFITWNNESEEGSILLDLFQPIKKVDDFLDNLVLFCDKLLDENISNEIKFGDYLERKKSLDEKKMRLVKAQVAINDEKVKIQKDKQKLKKKDFYYKKKMDDFDTELKTTQKQDQLSIKKSPYRRLLGLSKIKSVFKFDSSKDAEAGIEPEETETEVIKAEVMTMPYMGEAVAVQLPGPQECGVCQGEIEPEETFIKCSCDLLTHVGCIIYDQICPQCGRELDLELILPDGVNEVKKKGATKKPLIYKAETREIEELSPPTTSYFAHIPETTTEESTKDFVSSYYTDHKMGESKDIDNTTDIDMFISAEAAKKMFDHCYEQGRKKEVMGLILGKTYTHNKKLYSIAKDIATSDLDATKVNVKFKSFEKLFEQLGELSYDYQILGWYHSHPGHTCFMSDTDVDTQKTMFKLPYQMAIVIDPIKFDMKAFALDQETKENVKESGYAIIDFDD